MKYWILTNSGVQFDLENPTPDMVRIEDIAHALALTCRYNGHCDWFYSVAQHSVLVAQACPPKFRLWGLLHDAAEAYICDMTRPLKHLIPQYCAVEQRIMKAIVTRFRLDPPTQPDEVTLIDNRMLKTEKLILFSKEASRRVWDESIERLEPLDVSIPEWHRISAQITFMECFRTFSNH